MRAVLPPSPLTLFERVALLDEPHLRAIDCIVDFPWRWHRPARPADVAEKLGVTLNQAERVLYQLAGAELVCWNTDEDLSLRAGWPIVGETR